VLTSAKDGVKVDDVKADDAIGWVELGVRRLENYDNLSKFEQWVWRKIFLVWTLSWMSVLLSLSLVHLIVRGLLLYPLNKLANGLAGVADWVAYNPLAFDKKNKVKGSSEGK
jgi:hypothetical protein